MYKGETNFPAGVPVSLDFEGYVQRGAGFGIYREKVEGTGACRSGLYDNVGGSGVLYCSGQLTVHYDCGIQRSAQRILDLQRQGFV